MAHTRASSTLYGTPNDPRLATPDVLHRLNIGERRTLEKIAELIGAESVPEAYKDPVTGLQTGFRYPVRTWRIRDVEAIEQLRVMSKKGRWKDRGGRWWLSPQRAWKKLRRYLRSLKLSAVAGRWCYTRCPYLGRKFTTQPQAFGFGKKATWVLENDVDEVVRLLRDKKKKVRLARIKKKYGLSWAQLTAWESDCPHLPGGRLVPARMPGGKGNRGGIIKEWYEKDIQTIRRSIGRKEPSDGVFDEPEGRRLTLTKAAQERNIPRPTLENYTKPGRCPFLPEKQLPTADRKQQRRPFTECATVTDTDLDRLIDGMRQARESRPPAGRWESRRDMANRYRLQAAGQRMTLFSLLANLRRDESKPVGAFLQRKKYHNRPGLKRNWLYNVDDFERWLAGRNLAEVLRLYRESGWSELPRDGGAEGLSRQDAERQVSRPVVEINGPTNPVLVRGKDKGVLSPSKYRVIEALVNAWPGGLTLEKLATNSHYSAPLALLREMCKDEDWRSVIERPGRGYRGGYRIVRA